MIRIALLLGLAGIALATGLVIYQGLDAIVEALAVAGIGILWASLFHVVPMALNARAWQVLLPRGERPSLPFFAWAVWVREAVNGLLPVARIGGEVASARLLFRAGVETGPAVASLVVDMTLCIATQFVFTVAGLALLLRRTDDAAAVGGVALGLAVSVPLVAALLAVQRVGLFGLLAKLFRAMFGSRFDGLVGGAAALDAAVRALYARRAGLASCTLWQLVAWAAGAGEIWLALRYLGHPVDTADALAIEALIQAVSSAAFVVPSAIGVQEVGFFVLGGAVGLTHEVALALALARRARDVIVFVPALIAWQLVEGRLWWRGRYRGGGLGSPSSAGSTKSVQPRV